MGFFTSCNCMLSVKSLGKTNTCLVVNLRETIGQYCEMMYCWVLIEGGKMAAGTTGGCKRTAVTAGRCNRAVITSGG